ncbi:hypothetical protein PFICI_03767 [Pestalotiopsis fici W106-1]|uniref:RNase MRP protein 1 RNA binding domain-containing protein n=1 Tax=Pestalotiopsis fici (strain W106-1 / CGMCC3.15140) TaxID=1229662 RepID=W3XJW3_PESFW|nr:uncharacterized protein PFICI_03767 [Pestalotiopsis fici W106-1]ETS85742.1 hypothetical protein PFICI_03767 [Pestalotiopsis fici W106-1]
MAATKNTVTTTLAAAAAAAAETEENVYQTCLGKLQPLVPVLAGFNHRNRSQHRHARWWAAFGSLRRNLGRLVADLEKAYALSKKSSRSGSSSSGKKKRKREGKGDDGDGSATAVGEGHRVKKGPVEVRAVWMRDHEVPGCYVAFSQLAADNQFAVLGLALLGILATVHDVCVRLVGEAPAVSKPAVSPSSLSVPVGRNLTSPGDAAAAKTGETKKSIGGGGGGGGGGVMTPAAMDLGQVVSRKDVAAALASSSSSLLSKSKPPKACAQEDIASASTAFPRRVQDGEAPPPPPQQPVKRKKKDPSTSKTALFTDSTPSTIKAAEKQSDGKVAKGDKIKKKKKKTKGDEFDALFSSLV